MRDHRESKWQFGMDGWVLDGCGIDVITNTLVLEEGLKELRQLRKRLRIYRC